MIRFADREGWKAAKIFKGDDIANTPEEAKRMKKAKKDAEKEKEAEKKRQKEAQEKRESRGRFWGGYGASAREFSTPYSHPRVMRQNTDNRVCHKCQRVGHIARNCPKWPHYGRTMKGNFN